MTILLFSEFELNDCSKTLINSSSKFIFNKLSLRSNHHTTLSIAACGIMIYEKCSKPDSLNSINFFFAGSLSLFVCSVIYINSSFLLNLFYLFKSC